MTEPSTDDRLIEQLASTLRELPDDELARELQAPIDTVLRERLFDLMETNRVSATTPAPAANDSGRRRVIWGGGLAAAAAAVLVLVFGRPERPDEAPQGELEVAAKSVPAHGFDMDGGRATERGHTAPSDRKPQYPPTLWFTWILKPDYKPLVDAPKVERVVRMCAKSANGKQVEIDVRPFLEVGKHGVVRLHGQVSALGLSPGDWTIKVAIGDPAVLPGMSDSEWWRAVSSICRATTAAGIDVRERDIEVLGDL